MRKEGFFNSLFGGRAPKRTEAKTNIPVQKNEEVPHKMPSQSFERTEAKTLNLSEINKAVETAKEEKAA